MDENDELVTKDEDDPKRIEVFVRKVNQPLLVLN
jgi:hypothetical protein